MKKLHPDSRSAVPCLKVTLTLLISLLLSGWFFIEAGFGLYDWLFLAVNLWVVLLLVSYWCIKQYEYIWQIGISVSILILAYGIMRYSMPSFDLSTAQPIIDTLQQRFAFFILPETLAPTRASSAPMLAGFLLAISWMLSIPLTALARRILKLLKWYSLGLEADRKIDSWLERLSLTYGFSKPLILLLLHCGLVIVAMVTLAVLA